MTQHAQRSSPPCSGCFWQVHEHLDRWRARETPASELERGDEVGPLGAASTVAPLVATIEFWTERKSIEHFEIAWPSLVYKLSAKLWLSLPSGKRLHNYCIKNPHIEWSNQLYLWPFSIAMLRITTREYPEDAPASKLVFFHSHLAKRVAE